MRCSSTRQTSNTRWRLRGPFRPSPCGRWLPHSPIGRQNTAPAAQSNSHSSRVDENAPERLQGSTSRSDALQPASRALAQFTPQFSSTQLRCNILLMLRSGTSQLCSLPTMSRWFARAIVLVDRITHRPPTILLRRGRSVHACDLADESTPFDPQLRRRSAIACAIRGLSLRFA